jgi:hypothetical protein
LKVRAIAALVIALVEAACAAPDPVVQREGTQGTITRIQKVFVSDGRVRDMDSISGTSEKGREGQQIMILLDNDSVVRIVQHPPDFALKVGDKVRLEGKGQELRIAPR